MRLHIGWTTNYLDAFAWDLDTHDFAPLHIERYVTGRLPPNYPVPVTESVNLLALWCLDPLDSDWNMRYGEWINQQPID